MAAIYLAGPLGFLEAGRRYHNDVLVPAVAERFVVLDPWESGEQIIGSYVRDGHDGLSPERMQAMNDEIGGANRALIDRCDGVLAVLDGSDVDSGTASEIGYAAALGKPIVGLRTDLRLSGENAAAVVNLQVAYFVRHSGGAIARDLGGALDALADLVSPRP